MHPRIEGMPPAETVGQRFARQMADFLTRHETTPQEIEKRTGIAYTTINRWLNASAKTRPYQHKLEAVAAAYHEDVDLAFPGPNQELIELNGRRIALKSLDGKPLPADFLDQVKHLSVDRAADIHAAKQGLKKKR